MDRALSIDPQAAERRDALVGRLFESILGTFDVFSVYGHTGDPCPRCRAPLVRTVQAGRTTTFCKKCQVRRR